MDKITPKQIKNIISNMKSADKKEEPKQYKKVPFNPVFKERDMRREAMDMGAHGASEYFKDTLNDQTK